jgi:two-component system chemotaxis response regulator CheB
MKVSKKYQAVVLGTSAGGLSVLSKLLTPLPADYSVPIVVVQHRSRDDKDTLETILQLKCKIKIKQADEKEMIKGGTVFIAPPDYHLLIENNKSFSLSADAPVKYSRPSIDVLFESAAAVFNDSLIGIILTGSNDDGTHGMKLIKQNGGFTIAQDPSEAEYSDMPKAAIKKEAVEHIWPLQKILDFLIEISKL